MKTNNIVPKLRFPEFSDNETWKLSQLKSCIEILMCKRIFSNQTSEKGDIPFYKIGTLGKKADCFISNELFLLYKEKYNYPQKDEILISCSGTVGKCVKFNGEDAYFQDSNIVWLRIINNKLINNFLYYTISKIDWNKLNTTTISRIYSTNIKELIIPYPNSLHEQQKIADCLASLDELLNLEEKKLSALQKYKKGLLQKIFSQEIRFKDDNGNNFLDWKEKKLGELGIFYRGHSYNANDVSGKGLLVLRSNNINNVINYNELQFVTKPCNIELLLQNEDIVICMSNGSKKLVGKSATFIVTDKYNYVTVGAFCSIFRSNSKLAKYLFQLNNYKEQINFILEGANINNLKNSELELFKFLFPVSSQEQQKIADFLSSVDELIENQELKIEQLKQHKKGLLQGLFPNMNGVENA